MTLENVRDAYEALSGKASDILRQFGFAAIALIWLFRVDTPKGPSLDNHLLWAAVWVFGAILFDLLQYLVGSAIWFVYFRYKENRVDDDVKFKAPIWLNWPTWGFFVAKTIAVVIAYLGFIVPYLRSRFAL